MGEDIRQFHNPEDNCIYFYDKRKQCYRKICDVASFADLPSAVKQQIVAAKKDAESIVGLPTE